MNNETIKEAREALDNMDDYARMNTGVNAIGPRGVLARFISEVERTTSPVSQMTDDLARAAKALLEEQETACLTDAMKALEEMELCHEQVEVSAKLLRKLFLALAAAAPHAQAVEPVADPRPLFDRKLADLQQRGYEVIGRILHKDGEYALFDSSCRWLTQPQYWRLMHEQDGSLFATPAAPAPYPTRECAAEALTPSVGAPAAPVAQDSKGE